MLGPISASEDLTHIQPLRSWKLWLNLFRMYFSQFVWVGNLALADLEVEMWIMVDPSSVGACPRLWGVCNVPDTARYIQRHHTALEL